MKEKMKAIFCAKKIIYYIPVHRYIYRLFKYKYSTFYYRLAQTSTSMVKYLLVQSAHLRISISILYIIYIIYNNVPHIKKKIRWH